MTPKEIFEAKKIALRANFPKLTEADINYPENDVDAMLTAAAKQLGKATGDIKRVWATLPTLPAKV